MLLVALRLLARRPVSLAVDLAAGRVDAALAAAAAVALVLTLTALPAAA